MKLVPGPKSHPHKDLVIQHFGMSGPGQKLDGPVTGTLRISALSNGQSAQSTLSLVLQLSLKCAGVRDAGQESLRRDHLELDIRHLSTWKLQAQPPSVLAQGTAYKRIKTDCRSFRTFIRVYLFLLNGVFN